MRRMSSKGTNKGSSYIGITSGEGEDESSDLNLNSNLKEEEDKDKDKDKGRKQGKQVSLLKVPDCSTSSPGTSGTPTLEL